METLEKKYTELETKKRQVERRAELAAKLTIPSIFPEEGHNESSDLPIPNQSLGSRASNNLASKMMLALFPPNTAFFRLDSGMDTPGDLTEQEEEMLAEYQYALTELESDVVSYLETTKLRSVMPNAFLNLIITGNTLIDIDKDAEVRAMTLRNYVVERDNKGTVVLLIVKESVSPLTLKEELLQQHFTPQELKDLKKSEDKNIDLYTVQKLTDDGKKYELYQEINNKRVEGSEGKLPKEAPRFIATRWTSIDGEEYGRGLVEDYLGDFLAYDSLSLDMRLVSNQNAKVVFTVEPNSYIKRETLQNAESGDVITGNADDVKTIQTDKNADLSVVFQKTNELKQSLSEAFLLHSSVQRNAERVTAEEIRYMAQELEDALGGVYSLLGQEVQRPMVNRLLDVLKRNKEIPEIPKGVKLKIVTGLDALGRSHETNKLITLIRNAQELLGAEEVATRIKSDLVFMELGKGIGVDAKKFLRSEEEVQQMQQQQMMNSITESSAPGAIQQLLNQGVNTDGES